MPPVPGVANVQENGIGWCVVCQQYARPGDPAHAHPQDLVDAAYRNRWEYYRPGGPGHLEKETTPGTPLAPL